MSDAVLSALPVIGSGIAIALLISMGERMWWIYHFFLKEEGVLRDRLA
jgi:hypothetical protein